MCQILMACGAMLQQSQLQQSLVSSFHFGLPVPMVFTVLCRHKCLCVCMVCQTDTTLAVSYFLLILKNVLKLVSFLSKFTMVKQCKGEKKWEGVPGIRDEGCLSQLKCLLHCMKPQFSWLAELCFAAALQLCMT